MKMDIEQATIRVYDHSGNAKVTIQARYGDEVGYKRNGQAGYLRCIVDEVRADKIALVPLDGRRRFWVPSDSRQFMNLYRNGERITA
jgi:hypothetical protein